MNLPDSVTAGARISVVIEDTIESLNGHEIRLTNGIALTDATPDRATISLLEPGWHPGDVVNDGYSDLWRIRRDDGVDLWQRANGRAVYDDETSLASLTVVHRAGLPKSVGVTVTVTHVPDPPGLQQEIARLRREWPGGRR